MSPATFTWANRGVDLERDRLLWWEGLSAVAFASGAASEQSFGDFVANGPSVDGAPDDVLAELRARLTPIIRAARPEDGLANATVRVESWRVTYAHLLSAEFLAALDPTEDADGWARTAEAIAADPSRGIFVVAELDGAVRGFAIAGPPRPGEQNPPRDWQLPLIYQDAAMHGTGSGQALLDAAIGDRPTVLWVAEDNPRAIAFYRRNGFTPDGERTTDPRWEDLAEIRMVR